MTTTTTTTTMVSQCAAVNTSQRRVSTATTKRVQRRDKMPNRVIPRATASGKTPLRLDLCELPGDPSLVVHCNVKMGDKKRPFMLAASRSIAETLKKPESYVAVCAMDGLDMVWGGSDAPCALCAVNSLGAINLENNKELSEDICELLGEFGIASDRVYITFTDVPRENMGYDGATFAG
jgi:phenylpyruvate tautomerase